jgi:hypothetical protein
MLLHVIGHRPAHDPAAEDVLDGGEVEPAFHVLRYVSQDQFRRGCVAIRRRSDGRRGSPGCARSAARPPALVGRQALGPAGIDVELTRPVTQRLRRDTQLRRQHRHRLAAAFEQANRLAVRAQKGRSHARRSPGAGERPSAEGRVVTERCQAPFSDHSPRTRQLERRSCFQAPRDTSRAAATTTRRSPTKAAGRTSRSGRPLQWPEPLPG